MLFLRDVDLEFHDDFLILCQVLNKSDGLSQHDIKTAFDNITSFTKWETELVPETYIKPSLDVIDDLNNMKEDILYFFDTHFRGLHEDKKQELFTHTTNASIKNKNH